MKISIVLPNLKFGGAEKLHLNLAEDWCKRGHKVQFVLMSKDGEFLSLVPDKIEVISLRVNRLRSVISPLVSYFRNYQPDIILTAMWPLTSLAVIAWIISGKVGKIFLSEHIHLTSAATNEINASKLYLKLTIFLTYRLSSGIIAVSKGVRDNLSSIGHIRKNEITVIYNPIVYKDRHQRLPHSDRIKLWGGEFSFNILSVAELKTQKDHKTLIKAISLLPDDLNIKLIILGDGELMNELLLLIKSLNLLDKVELPGFVYDPYPWYGTADLFVLSSRWEGFGNVIVEALECGVPVVSTDCPSGPKEILDNGNYGKLVPVGDYVALSDAINLSLNESYNRERLIKRAQDFSVPKISKQYLDYFELKN